MTSLKFSVVPHSLPEMFKQQSDSKNIYIYIYHYTHFYGSRRAFTDFVSRDMQVGNAANFEFS